MDSYAPCPICRQYSHSIGENELARAFRHFHSMLSHRGDGIPTQNIFDEATRNAAQVLMAAARTPSRNDVLEEAALAAESYINNAEDWDSSYWDQCAESIATAIRARKDQIDG